MPEHVCGCVCVTCSPLCVLWAVSHTGSHTVSVIVAHAQTYSGFTIIQDPTWRISNVSEPEFSHSGFTTCYSSESKTPLSTPQIFWVMEARMCERKEPWQMFMQGSYFDPLAHNLQLHKSIHAYYERTTVTESNLKTKWLQAHLRGLLTFHIDFVVKPKVQCVSVVFIKP